MFKSLLERERKMEPLQIDITTLASHKTRRMLLQITAICALCVFVVAGYFVIEPFTGFLAVTPTVPALTPTPTPSAINSHPPYYGVSMDMSQILPESKLYVKNSKGQDLIDIAASLGVNMVRITNAVRSFDGTQDSLYTKQQWDEVLNKLASKNIKSVILIETASSNAANYTINIQPVYLTLVQNYIRSDVFSNPDVYSVDIKNEPILTDANVHMLSLAANLIRAKYPSISLTVGWWGSDTNTKDPNGNEIYKWDDFAAGRKLNTIVDYYSIHMYGLERKIFNLYYNPDLRAKSFISSAIAGLQTSKPIFIEEFGEANGDAVSDQDTIGSPELQASAYAGVYQALNELKDTQIIGALAFQMYSRTAYPDAWSIVKDKGNFLYPAASVLQDAATGKTLPSLNLTTADNSGELLLKATDTGSSHSLNIGDRLGIKLKLDKTINYSLLLQQSANQFGQIEAFHFDTDSGYFTAVFKALKKGSVKLVVNQESVCKAGTKCKVSSKVIFTANVSVQ